MKNYLSSIPWGEINIDRVVENSFKDFHAKGLDYLCLARTEACTLKAYFFADGMESQKVGEVVSPHDHRYPFSTQCFSGTIRNKWYRAQRSDRPLAPVYQTYEWRTPLLGGNGFTHIGDIRLEEYRHLDAGPGGRYWMDDYELHTIQVLAPETCIVLMQFADTVPADEPTYTYTQDREPPSLDGLYGKFTADQAVKRLNLLRELAEKL